MFLKRVNGKAFSQHPKKGCKVFTISHQTFYYMAGIANAREAKPSDDFKIAKKFAIVLGEKIAQFELSCIYR
jgi:hypothetical protein